MKTKAEMRKLFIGIRDTCKNPKFEEISGNLYSKGDEYSRIHRVLDETGTLDYDYADNLGNRNGYELARTPENLTFKDCSTALTFLLRAERFSEGAFTEALKDGTVYKLLSRMVETLP